MSARDPAFDALSADDIYQEARDRLDLATAADSDNDRMAKADMQFREGQQWDDPASTSQADQSPQLTINLTDALVRRVVNNMKQQRPRGKCHPVGDGADIDIAEVLNGLGRHIEYRSEASVAYDTAGDSAVTCGWGYWRLLSEYVAPDSFDQELRIVPIRNIFTVKLDPSAVMPTGQDARWGIISAKMARTEYRRLTGRTDDPQWSDSGDLRTREWENREEIRLAEYFRLREQATKLYRLTDAAGREFIKYESEMPSVPSLLAAGLNVTGERKSTRTRLEWFQLNGSEVIDRRILPGRYIPIIRCEGNAVDLDGKIIRRGMVRAMMDAARMVNYAETAKIMRLGLAPKAPWVMAEGQMEGHPEWNNANTQAYSVLTYKPTVVNTSQGDVLLPPPMRQPPAQLEAGFAEFTETMKSNLMAIAGMPNEPGQDMRGQVVSGRAIQRRDRLSDQAHFQFYDNQTLAIAHTWRIMLDWIPTIYSTERIQRIIGEDNVPQMVTINERSKDPAVQTIKNDLTVGRYDVVMDTGPGYDTKREEAAETMTDLLASQPIAEIIVKTAPDLLFRGMDFPYAQEIADRLAAQTPDGLQKIMADLPARAKALVQSLAGQNQQLQQALNQAQLEIKYGLAKAHLAATTKAHDTEVSAETKRLDTAVRAHTALAVEEIKAGASLMNTHVEAKHHEREAERMIETAERTEASPSNGAAQ